MWLKLIANKLYVWTMSVSISSIYQCLEVWLNIIAKLSLSFKSSLAWRLRLALFLIYPASTRPAGRPPGRPAARNSSEKASTEQNLDKEPYMNVVGPNLEDELNGWQMEDDLNFLPNGRRPPFFGKWKTTSIFWQIEDNLNHLLKKDNLIFWKMKGTSIL